MLPHQHPDTGSHSMGSVRSRVLAVPRMVAVERRQGRSNPVSGMARMETCGMDCTRCCRNRLCNRNHGLEVGMKPYKTSTALRREFEAVLAELPEDHVYGRALKRAQRMRLVIMESD